MTEIIHGTFNGYRTHNCRCAVCRKMWSEYVRNRNKIGGLCRWCRNKSEPGKSACPDHRGRGHKGIIRRQLKKGLAGK